MWHLQKLIRYFLIILIQWRKRSIPYESMYKLMYRYPTVQNQFRLYHLHASIYLP